jgi:PAS domain S-box-containing protein
VLPYRTSDNRIDGVVLTFVDITRRRAVETALRDSEEQHRLIVQSVQEHAIFLIGLDGLIATWNPGAARVLGYEQSEAVGQRFAILFAPEDRAAGMPEKELAGALEFGRAGDDRWHVRKDATRLWGSGSTTLLRNADGSPRGFVKILRDDTERKRNEEAMRGSEERNAAIIANAAVGLAELSLDGRLMRVNDALCGVLGRTAEGLIGRNVLELTHPEDVPMTRDALRKVVTTDKNVSIDKRQLRPDGSIVHVNVSFSPLGDENNRPYAVLAVTVDLTARRKAEENVRAGEHLYRTLAANLPNGAVFVVDRDLRYRLAEGQALTRAGLTTRDLEGKTLAEARGAEAAARYEPHYRAAFAGEPFRVEHTENGIDFITHGVPLRDDTGTVYAALAVSYDITERMEVERVLQEAKELAEAANHMKDEFLATLSHELRTPLSAVLIWSKLLRDAGVTSPNLAEGLEAIERSAEAQKQLIDDLLDSSRITSGKLRLEMQATDLVPLVREAVEAIVPTADARELILETDFGDNIGVVTADPDRIRQIVWNLLTNAVKFTPRGGRIDVGLWRRDGGITIRVADTGRGIDPAFLPHMFERFRQADPAMTRTSGGLGLGLSIVKQLVELHGGTIMAESNGAGQGAVFTVRLPLRALGRGRSAARAARIVEKPLPTDLSGVKVLLVEDQQHTREAVRTLLRHAGAGVTAVGATAEALAAFESDRPDVIVCDIGLPDTDGYTLLRQVRAAEAAAKTPPAPAIALTAFAREQDREAALAAGFDTFVTKPFEPDILLGLLAKLAGRAGKTKGKP